MNNFNIFSRLTFFTTIFALGVIMLGAFVRLSDAGLGCPDWPGCYGQITVPHAEHEVSRAIEAYPERPVEAHKAWKEMVHRYFAGTLGMLIVAVAVVAWRRRKLVDQSVILPAVLVGVVVFQALLGMWTVTLLLKPLIVTSHLLGGMTTVALLWWLTLRHSAIVSIDPVTIPTNLKPWAIGGLILVALQISLGGWTSANYAALACPDFPTCQLQWWPQMDFADAFVLWRGLGINYEYGVLDSAARTAIHMVHRMGALTVFIYVGLLAFTVFRHGDGMLRRVAAAVAAVLLLQISLGISNVYFSLPLPVAVMHNGGGALLLLSMVTLVHAFCPRRG